MEGRVLDGGHARRPAGLALPLGERVLHPAVGITVDGGELLQRERLPDPAAQVVEYQLELLE